MTQTENNSTGNAQELFVGIEGYSDKPGYLVTPCTDSKISKHVAFIVTGPRGEWGLMRNKNNPNLMFVVKSKGFGCGAIRGWEWFKLQADGKVTPYS